MRHRAKAVIVLATDGLVHISARASGSYRPLAMCDLLALENNVIPNEWKYCNDPLTERADLCDKDVTCLRCITCARR
jgi:hypothetical protein